MLRSFKYQSLFLAFILVSFYAQSEIRLPALIQSNMVIQQNSEVVLWGWADPGEEIKIKASWINDKIVAITNDEGNWRTTIKTGSAGGPYQIKLKGKGQKIELENILFGEVWICSGQSNMDFTLKRLGGWDADIFKEDKLDFKNSDYSTIRLFKVVRRTSDTLEDTCSGSWLVATLDNVNDFSAVAFFYGRELSRKLGVPVGLINSSWGGTPAQAWTSQEVIEASEELVFYHLDPEREYHPQDKPGSLYNGMIHPLLNYKIKGVIWYQGESNRNDAVHYTDLFNEMIWSWRKDFDQGIFPFYYVQIAPFRYTEPMAGALLREAQLRALETPATGMAVTLDIGDNNDIHPKNKQDVGKRLALNALAQTYGFTKLEYSGPVYTRGRVEDIPFIEDKKGIRLSFDHSDSGIELRDEQETGFIIAGKDQVFYEAMARAEGNSIFVWNDKVGNPYAVRYAFTNTPKSTLFNGSGLPASSFRTDQFQIITEEVNMSLYEGFTDKSIFLEMSAKDQDAQIRFTLDGTDPVLKSGLYIKPVKVIKSSNLKARVFNGKVPSVNISSVDIHFHKAIAKEITQNTSFNSKYPGGGDKALVNGLRGSVFYNDGNWQGYEGDDLDVIIDLKESKKVSKVSVAFLQDFENCIFLPDKVEFSFSEDGDEFIKIKTVNNNSSTNDEVSLIREFEIGTDGFKVRYIKVRAINIVTIPSWHPEAGEKAWLFTDEIVVE